MTTSPTTQAAPGAPSGRHPINIGHLVMGIAFTGLVGVWALVQGDVVDGGDIRWLLPVPWVLAGIAGLLATTVTGRDRWASRQTGWIAPSGDPMPHDPYDVDNDVTEKTSENDTEEIR